MLSHGTILTGGNKLFAIPLSAITLAHASDKSYILFNVSQDTLKNAPGFDKNNWPNMGDPAWNRNVDLTLTGAVEQGIRSSFNFARKGVTAEVLRRVSATTVIPSPASKRSWLAPAA